MTTRIDPRFAELKREGRAALVTYITAGDPDYANSLAVLRALPQAGADVIELGMPFTDPMADGPAIQAAGLRALKRRTEHDENALDRARISRGDDTTPIVLMGYYNPIYIYGVERFLVDAKRRRCRRADRRRSAAGGRQRTVPAGAQGRHQLHPAGDADNRRRASAGGARNTSGFVYYVSITGITGSAAPDTGKVRKQSRASSGTPSCRSASASACTPPNRPARCAQGADGVVVGSALVEAVRTLSMPTAGHG